jgi:hypothetical protein
VRDLCLGNWVAGRRPDALRMRTFARSFIDPQTRHLHKRRQFSTLPITDFQPRMNRYQEGPSDLDCSKIVVFVISSPGFVVIVVIVSVVSIAGPADGMDALLFDYIQVLLYVDQDDLFRGKMFEF